ncbi:hypothetical protein YC2023_059189 [Brassica napus]
MKYKKGITRPEMIIPESGHSAYDKAAQYFSIKLWRVPVDKDFIADVKAMTRHVNRNTIIVIFVGSAPGFPHGIIDPIEVDPFFFTTVIFRTFMFSSINLFFFFYQLFKDLPYYLSGRAKIYGLAPKGTSTVLYRNHEIRKHQFVAGKYKQENYENLNFNDGAWAAMMSLGEEGFTILISLMLFSVKANPGPITGGLAPIYGAAGKMPHRGIMVNDLLVSFMDSRY